MTKKSRLKTKLEEMTDAFISSENDEPSVPPQKASTIDPLRELMATKSLGGVQLAKTQIQREILRLQSMPADELNEVEAKRLDAYYCVLNKTDFYATSDRNVKYARFNTLYTDPIFHDIITAGQQP